MYRTMALYIKTNEEVQVLLSEIKKMIDTKDIVGWEYDEDGDFTCSDEKWKNKAWLTPTISGMFLKFGILGRKGVPMTKREYSYYHGYFSEMIMEHFFDEIESIKLLPPFKSILDTKDIEK